MQVEFAPTVQFGDAVNSWLEARSFNPSRRHRLIAPRTLKSYRQYSKALIPFFGALRLDAIHIGHIREYQKQRSQSAGPNKINQEVGMLVAIKKLSGSWTSELENFYEPFLHQESDIPKALTEEEQNHWLDIASSRERWKLVYCYSLVGLCTTASSNELRGIRLGDVNVRDAIVSIQASSAKNRHRIRPIPLNEQGVWAMEWLFERAQTLGATDPQHYLFPFRPCRNTWDVTRQMSDFGMFKLWNEVRDSSGLVFPPNNLRHTAITRYAEAGTPIQVILSYAGHMSLKMQMHYTWISEQAKRKWQDRLTKRSPRPIGRFHAASAS